jgi:hypothetical protein
MAASLPFSLFPFLSFSPFYREMGTAHILGQVHVRGLVFYRKASYLSLSLSREGERCRGLSIAYPLLSHGFIDTLMRALSTPLNRGCYEVEHWSF